MIKTCHGIVWESLSKSSLRSISKQSISFRLKTSSINVRNHDILGFTVSHVPLFAALAHPPNEPEQSTASSAQIGAAL